jgi:hypothetical protein
LTSEPSFDFEVSPVYPAVRFQETHLHSTARSLVSQRKKINRKEPEVAGKKRPKSLAQSGTKAPAKPKRPKKTSRGK